MQLQKIAASLRVEKGGKVQNEAFLTALPPPATITQEQSPCERCVDGALPGAARSGWGWCRTTHPSPGGWLSHRIWAPRWQPAAAGLEQGGGIPAGCNPLLPSLPEPGSVSAHRAAPMAYWTLQHRVVMAASPQAELEPFVRPSAAAHCISSAELETPAPPQASFFGVQMGFDDAKPVGCCLQSLQTPLTWELWASSCLKSAQHSTAKLC